MKIHYPRKQKETMSRRAAFVKANWPMTTQAMAGLAKDLGVYPPGMDLNRVIESINGYRLRIQQFKIQDFGDVPMDEAGPVVSWANAFGLDVLPLNRSQIKDLISKYRIKDCITEK